MLRDRDQRAGALLILLSVLGYSFFPLWVKALSEAGLPSLDIATWRFIFALPLVWLAVTLRGARTLSEPLPRLTLVGIGLLLAAAAVTGISGIQLIPASVYVMLFYSNSAMIAVISVLRGERLEPMMWVALAMTLVGVALTLPDLSDGLRGANAEGVAFALVNAFVVALYFVATSHALRNCTDTTRASIYTIAGALLPLAVLGLVRGVMIPPDAKTWALLAGFAVTSTVIPIAALNAGLQKLGAAKAGIISTSEPVLTLTWSALLLGERLLPVQLVGGVLILASVIMMQLRRTPQPAREVVGEAGV